jgi:transcriptional regulator
MYIPASFKVVDDGDIAAFLERYDFPTIVSATRDGLFATHTPVTLRRGQEGLVIEGHVARANVHWKSMDGVVDAIAIFHGPHAYVSPTWFASSPAVPTWNYAVVHAYGKPQAREDRAFIEDGLRALLRRYESGRPNGLQMEDLAPDYRNRLMEGVVGFQMPVVKLEAKFKLGQNRSAIDRARTIEALEHESSAESSALASFMRSYLRL